MMCHVLMTTWEKHLSPVPQRRSLSCRLRLQRMTVLTSDHRLYHDSGLLAIATIVSSTVQVCGLRINFESKIR